MLINAVLATKSW